jgi:hypothetical protein
MPFFFFIMRIAVKGSGLGNPACPILHLPSGLAHPHVVPGAIYTSRRNDLFPQTWHGTASKRHHTSRHQRPQYTHTHTHTLLDHIIVRHIYTHTHTHKCQTSKTTQYRALPRHYVYSKESEVQSKEKLTRLLLVAIREPLLRLLVTCQCIVLYICGSRNRP